MGYYTLLSIDTPLIRLNPDLEELVELMAENNHNHGSRSALQRMAWGSARNDEKREHADRVPYKNFGDRKEYESKIC